MARVVGSLLLVLGLVACATPVGFAPTRDANADAPYDPWGDRTIGGIRAGGSVDAGHRDTGVVGGGCAARILVVFDRSLSMDTQWMGATTSGPRWQIAEAAVTSAVSPRQAQLMVGALLFPSPGGVAPGPACDPVDPIGAQIPFQSGSSFLTRWSATWSAPMLLGSTPIDAAFDAADAALTGAAAETAVVLLTDGEPTCSGTISASMRAAAWHARGIPTWVVGLPGSEAGMAYLAAIATAGGTGAPISVDDPGALGTALSGIAGGQVQSRCGP